MLMLESNMSESYLEIQLDKQPIELCKLLKIADLVAGGGEAKIVISEGYVLVNGEVEYQKRKKVYHNDVVEFNGEVIQVIIDDNLSQTLTETAVPLPSSHSPQTKSPKKAVPTNEGTANSSKRKPISF
mgnify:CR=1 FL=1